MDTTTEAVILAGFVAGVMLGLVFLAVTLRAIELAFPQLSKWLDEHVGEDRAF